MNIELTRQLKADEGVRACVYLDSLGFSTIGAGRLVDSRKPGAGLRPAEIDYLLQNDIDDRTAALKEKLPWLYLLDPARQGVLIAMSFQLGTNGLLGFRRTLDMCSKGRWGEAAENMLLSKWAEQTPARAKRLSRQLETGIWQFQDGA